MKILNLLLAILFVVFAFLQLNDPDPVLWILIYGSMAVMCILAAFKYYYYPLVLGLLILFAGYSFVYFDGVLAWFGSEDKSMLFDDLAKMQYHYIEESREFLGLMICVFVLIMHLIGARLQHRKAFN